MTDQDTTETTSTEYEEKLARLSGDRGYHAMIEERYYATGEVFEDPNDY